MGTIGVGMPQWIFLNHFGRLIYEAFGEYPYLVGSATQGKQWRDVDVRVILSDEDYARVVGKLESPPILNKRWSAMCLAFSVLGKEMTGLPIDFQIDQQTDANEKYKGDRHSLILYGDIQSKGETTK